MVVFTCGHCGESLQKPKVEKHYLTKCRNKKPNLSCMDCFKDFFGNDYEEHTKCITEEQRYAAKGFVAKEKKGEQKQNAWVEMVQSVLDEEKGAPKNVLRILEAISKHNNTPRKKPKFINFVKNICGNKTNPKDIDGAWDLISVKLSALSNRNQNQKQNGQVNGDSNVKENKDDLKNGDDLENKENDKDATNGEKVENGNHEVVEKNDEGCTKLSKKQRKEEKKRKKYEAALLSAAEQPKEEEITNMPTKKEKKKKNRTESTNNGDLNEEEQEDDKKNKKRKRQDTVNGVQETAEVAQEVVEIKPQVNGEKTKKKKQKVDDIEKSISLHDQNVAKGDVDVVNAGNFNWHAVILSVLQKKGDEIPFKRLQKKVLGEYSEATGQEVDDRIADKFIKKLKSAPNVRVDKNRVILID